MERGPVQLNIPRDMFYGDVVTKIPAPKRVEMSAGGPNDLATGMNIAVKFFKHSHIRSFCSKLHVQRKACAINQVGGVQIYRIA